MKQLIYDNGCDYDLTISYASSNKKQVESIYKQDCIDNRTKFLEIGDAKVNNSEYFVNIVGYDDQAKDLFKFKLLKGRFPKKDNEIALEGWMLEQFKVTPKIGDKINLPCELKRGKNDIGIDNEFTLVGIFDYKFNNNCNKNIAKGYITMNSAEKKISNNFKVYQENIKLKKDMSIQNAYKKFTSITEENKVDVKKNTDKEFVLNGLKSIEYINFTLNFVVCVISSILIYNVFNTSIVQRVKELGMLRALGSTPMEIMILIIGEGVFLGIIFIPISVLLGNYICKMVMSVNKFNGLFTGGIIVPKKTIVFSFIFGFMCIFLGTFSSGRKAAKISPMEAIRTKDSLDTKIKKTNKISFKNNKKFIKNMAYLNINRNRKKFISTVISLSISIMMFLLVNYIINCSDPIENLKNNMGGDFIVNCNDFYINERYIKQIENLDHVKEIKKNKVQNTFIKVSKEVVTKDGIKHLQEISKSDQYLESNLKNNIYEFHGEIHAFDDKKLKKIKENIDKKNNILDKVNKEPSVILVQNVNYNNYTDLKLGDNIEIEVPVFKKGKFAYTATKKVKVGAILKEKFFQIKDGMLSLAIIMDNKTAEQKLNFTGYQEIKINLDSKKSYDYVEKNLKSLIKGKPNLNLVSYKEELNKVKQSNRKTSLVLYCFVGIVALVSIVNIFNIMGMNVILRKKELNMLRAVGMSKRELSEMIECEGNIYGISSVVMGIILGSIGTYIFYICTRKNLMPNMTWNVSITLIIFMSLIVLGICFIASLSASKLINNKSIVDSIRDIE